ncbi:hypothetical protein LMG31506_04773 [Cupriavidus yeoncheonensis]|uniref:DUF1427 family protein n=1 Tax=Cupriavidus yeoncheonensis TaxID=1462994 RepID=A0A916MX65_9BURK|nr:DUF1427 family protein [Cupriavidus yeoncheonensis]CAG2153219.1 hypothetical protein LMG31506_04773 [Cupriavidus yeoncheonensis]
MKSHLFSLGAGVLVGVIYYLIGVRSPAPPLVALAGLLGILAGEQLIPVSKQYLSVAIHATATRASDDATAAPGTMQQGVFGTAAVRRTAKYEEPRT